MLAITFAPARSDQIWIERWTRYSNHLRRRRVVVVRFARIYFFARCRYCWHGATTNVRPINSIGRTDAGLNAVSIFPRDLLGFPVVAHCKKLGMAKPILRSPLQKLDRRN